MLYYVTWDSVCRASRFLLPQVFRSVMGLAHDAHFTPPLITQIDCFDYNDVCAREQVFTYPTVKLIHSSGGKREVYMGTLGVRDLTMALVTHAAVGWWPRLGVQITNREQLKARLAASKALADEVFILSGEDGSAMEAAARHLTDHSHVPGPLLLRVSSGSLLADLLP